MENLYSKIPPTKLRNKEEKFSPANTDSKFWTLIADLFSEVCYKTDFSHLDTKAQKRSFTEILLFQQFFLPHTQIGGTVL